MQPVRPATPAARDSVFKRPGHQTYFLHAGSRKRALKQEAGGQLSSGGSSAQTTKRHSVSGANRAGEHQRGTKAGTLRVYHGIGDLMALDVSIRRENRATFRRLDKEAERRCTVLGQLQRLLLSDSTQIAMSTAVLVGHELNCRGQAAGRNEASPTGVSELPSVRGATALPAAASSPKAPPVPNPRGARNRVRAENQVAAAEVALEVENAAMPKRRRVSSRHVLSPLAFVAPHASDQAAVEAASATTASLGFPDAAKKNEVAKEMDRIQKLPLVPIPPETIPGGVAGRVAYATRKSAELSAQGFCGVSVESMSTRWLTNYRKRREQTGGAGGARRKIGISELADLMVALKKRHKEGNAMTVLELKAQLVVAAFKTAQREGKPLSGISASVLRSAYESMRALCVETSKADWSITSRDVRCSSPFYLISNLAMVWNATLDEVKCTRLSGGAIDFEAPPIQLSANRIYQQDATGFCTFSDNARGKCGPNPCGR